MFDGKFVLSLCLIWLNVKYIQRVEIGDTYNNSCNVIRFILDVGGDMNSDMINQLGVFFSTSLYYGASDLHCFDIGHGNN